jgi:hypothetical protein
MTELRVQENHRLVSTPPFMSIVVEGVTKYSAADLVRIYKETGEMKIDFGNNLRNSHYYQSFRFIVREPDVLVATYAKFASFTKRNSDSIIITGVGETTLETIVGLLNDFNKKLEFETKAPTEHVVEDLDMLKQQHQRLVRESSGRTLREIMEWYSKYAKISIDLDKN